jgi:hypothetical protein
MISSVRWETEEVARRVYSWRGGWDHGWHRLVDQCPDEIELCDQRYDGLSNCDVFEEVIEICINQISSIATGETGNRGSLRSQH